MTDIKTIIKYAAIFGAGYFTGKNKLEPSNNKLSGMVDNLIADLGINPTIKERALIIDSFKKENVALLTMKILAGSEFTKDNYSKNDFDAALKNARILANDPELFTDGFSPDLARKRANGMFKYFEIYGADSLAELNKIAVDENNKNAIKVLRLFEQASIEEDASETLKELNNILQKTE